MKLERSFYRRDVLDVAPELLGKVLVKPEAGGRLVSFTITETEAYRGEEDRACHAHKGLTQRTRVMFEDGGRVYMYLVYGMYWMLNVVTSVEGDPQAVLIRALREASGPGRLTKLLGLGKDYYGEDLVRSRRLWIEDRGINPAFSCTSRIGIDYAGVPWKDMPWRYVMDL